MKRSWIWIICVIMGAETRDIRNANATKLLDWGFANYSLYSVNENNEGNVKIVGGVKDSVGIVSQKFDCGIDKGQNEKIERIVEIDENILAPIDVGECVGKVKYISNGTLIGQSDIVTTEKVDKIAFRQVFCRLFYCFLLG